MAKFGYLYLNDGRWGTEQVVPHDYVRLATTRQSDGDSTGGTPYGYQWWVTEVGGHAAYFALGFGGQYVYVVPDLDLVVVLAAGFETPPPVLRSPRFIIEALVVPAVSE
jgi:CubicO group peptidase (beta-lactamase class C family)